MRNKFPYTIETNTLVTPELSALWSDDFKDVFLVTITDSYRKVKRYWKIPANSGAAMPSERFNISH